jgi:hypothetical protein
VSDRLDELRRQRDLLRENLAFIEREIAAETRSQGGTLPPPLRLPDPVEDRTAEAILAEYQRPPAAISQQAKVGCIAYFAGALLLLLALAAAAAFFYYRSVRGH